MTYSFDPLFPVQVAHAIGNYQKAIQEGQRLLTSDLTKPALCTLVSLMWRSAVAMGDVNPANTVFAGWTGLSDLPKFVHDALLLWAALLHCRRTKVDADYAGFVERARLIAHDAADQEEEVTVVPLMAAALRECGALEAAFDFVKGREDLPSRLLVVQLMLDLHRPDAAAVRLEQVKAVHGDDARVQLIEAGSLKLQQSEERMVRDALYTFQELAEVNGQSGKLLALQAIASLRLGRNEEATELISAASKMAPWDSNIMADYIAIAARQGTPLAAVNDVKQRLTKSAPTHRLLARIAAFQEALVKEA